MHIPGDHNQKKTTLIIGSIHITVTGAQAIVMPPGMGNHTIVMHRPVAQYPDYEFLDDYLREPPILDIRGEYMYPTSHEGHAGYECAYQHQPPQGDGRHNARSPIANMPLTLPGQVTEQEQHEGATIRR